MSTPSRLYKLVALGLSLCLLAGCNTLDLQQPYLGIFAPDTTDSGSAPPAKNLPQTLKLAYNPGDSLHPYRAVSQLNLSLLPLLYDPLVKLTPQFEATPFLAQTVENNGLTCMVTLRQGVSFGNGRTLSAQDVLYSFEQAKALPARYGALNELVADCQVVGGNTLRFTLHRADRNFPSLLTFPIIPADSAETPLPAGSGRYRLQAVGRGYEMQPRADHFSGETPFSGIVLEQLPDDEALMLSVKTGAVDLLYSDLSSPAYYSMSSSNKPVELSNLVYLGFSQEQELLAQPALRSLLGRCVNQEAVAAQVYSNRATAAFSPFPQNYYDLPGQTAPPSMTPEEREIAFDELGLSEKDSDGYRLKEGKKVSLRLLISMDNPFRQPTAMAVQNQLRSVGIEVVIQALPYQEYQRALAAGQYDLFLGEIKLSDNLDLMPVLSGAALGITQSVYDAALIADYRSYQSSGLDCATFVEHFSQSTPIIPLVYRRGMVAYSKGITANIVPTAQDIFYNLAQW